MVDCDAVTRVSNASYHLAIVASGALLDLELSEQRSSMGQGRFFPTPFGRTSNHHSSDSDMLQEKTTNLCASGVCLFLLSALCGFHCVERVVVFCLLSRAASSFRLLGDRGAS